MPSIDGVSTKPAITRCYGKVGYSTWDRAEEIPVAAYETVGGDRRIHNSKVRSCSMSRY
jgi:hypothetical protein